MKFVSPTKTALRSGAENEKLANTETKMSDQNHEKHSCCRGHGVGGIHALLDEFNRLKEEKEQKEKEVEVKYEIEGNKCVCRQH